MTLGRHARQLIGDWHAWLQLAQKAGIRIGLWDWNVGKSTVTWSEETYRQFGFLRDAFSGQLEDAVARIHPQDRSRVEEQIRKVQVGGSDYEAQYRIVRPDHSICWVDAYGVVARQGSTHRMLGVGIDITNRKKTEQSSIETQEKYLMLLNSTAEGIYGVDLRQNCTFCNPASLRLLGYSTCEELTGKTMHSIVHHTRADGTPYAASECLLSEASRKHKPCHIAAELLWRADGTSFWAECWSYPIDLEGKAVGSVVTFIDITERKIAEQALRQSEEKYRELVENATYGIFRSRPDGSLLDVNPALVAMLGYNSKDEVLARNLNGDIYEYIAQHTSILNRLELTGRVDGVEARWKRKDGKIISVRMSARRIIGKDGQISHFETLVEDVSERRNLEGQLRQAQKMEAIGLLAGGISHDFNNHLSVILGNADLLLENIESGRLQLYGEEIRKATLKAAELTRQLLAFSRKQVLYPNVLNLNDVVNDVVRILQRLIGRNIHIQVKAPDKLTSVRADRGQIEQILMNLATNARDAMPNGGRFTIRTENTELRPEDVIRHPYMIPGMYILLSASDTSVGMDEETRARAFEPFFTTKAQGYGTGLGLATVYGIVKQSGGYILISTKPGEGATFDIYLPQVDAPAPSLRVESGVRDIYKRGTETVLILEDEEALRRVTCECLVSGGYRVLQASEGGEAIKIAQQHKDPIHLIISDVILPDTTGPAAVAQVQEAHPETKALFVSGYADIPVAQILVTLGSCTITQTGVTRRPDEKSGRAAALPLLTIFKVSENSLSVPQGMSGSATYQSTQWFSGNVCSFHKGIA
jgi:two-component system, NtrC family, sensor kinase